MKVLFVHENTLGHGSYLPPFANYFLKHPELGVEPEILNATPLPPDLAREADYTVRGLRRFGLDNHFARWRKIVSAHVKTEVARRHGQFDAIVVNTQSVGLDLVDLKTPLLVAFDATFRQLSQSRWFSDPPLGRVGTKLIAGLIEQEKKLFDAAAHILPWSRKAAHSAQTDYEIAPAKTTVLPPSLEIPQARLEPKNSIPRALFIGGDFKRKGGDVLVECFRLRFPGKLELDLVTQSEVQPEPGIRVHRNIRAQSPEWMELWNQADMFVFPSRLETFGIVLVEALAFGAPIISSRAGAAEEILVNGQAGLLIDEVSVEELAVAIKNVLSNQAEAETRALIGRERATAEYDLVKNSEKLARLLN